MRTPILIIWATVALATAGLTGWYFLRTNDDGCMGDMVVPASLDGKGDFTALNHLAEPIDQTVFADGLNLVYFGYTFCPDICPLDTARNAEVTTMLAERGIDITPYFVTVDPKRDDVASMANYVNYTHDKMVGVTGTMEQLKTMQDIFGVVAQIEPSDDEYYTVNHTGFSYLVDEDGLVAAYSRALTSEQLADNITCHASKR